MANPEMGSLDGFGRLRCPCGGWMLLTCDKHGDSQWDGLLRRCWACSRVLTTDGVVIGRADVSA